MTDVPSGWDVGPCPRRGPLIRAVGTVLRISPLRWLTAELIPLGFLAIGAAITWMRPDYALAGLMVGAIAAPVKVLASILYVISGRQVQDHGPLTVVTIPSSERWDDH